MKEKLIEQRDLTLGQVVDITNELREKEEAECFNKLREAGHEFEAWKTIKLGAAKAEEFRRAWRDGRFEVGNEVSKKIFVKPTFKAATEESEVDLVKVMVGELCFKRYARCDQIYDRAKKLGLELCPAEVGPQLRLHYQDQPKGECVFIAMEPIFDGSHCLGVFRVERTDFALWLWTDWSDKSPSDSLWDADDQWIFCRPRK